MFRASASTHVHATSLSFAPCVCVCADRPVDNALPFAPYFRVDFRRASREFIPTPGLTHPPRYSGHSVETSSRTRATTPARLSERGKTAEFRRRLRKHPSRPHGWLDAVSRTMKDSLTRQLGEDFDGNGVSTDEAYIRSCETVSPHILPDAVIAAHRLVTFAH